jgi:hypothetical protein
MKSCLGEQGGPFRHAFWAASKVLSIVTLHEIRTRALTVETFLRRNGT